jgi:hypothetical protein
MFWVCKNKETLLNVKIIVFQNIISVKKSVLRVLYFIFTKSKLISNND